MGCHKTGRNTIAGNNPVRAKLASRESGFALVPLVGLLLGAALTAALWSHANRLSEQDAQAIFDQRVSHANLAIDRVLGELSSLLWMVRSVAENDLALEESTFQATMHGQNQRLFSAGLQYVGYVRASPSTVCIEASPDLPPDSAGAPAMLGEGCLKMAMVYPKPTNEHVLGQLQISERPELSGTIIRAMDYGYLALTPPLSSSRNNHSEPGLLVYMPVYRRGESLATVPARRRALGGMVVAAISLEDLVRAELGGKYFESMNVLIRDFGLVGRARAREQESSIVLDARSLLRAGEVSESSRFSNQQRVVSLERQHAGRFWSVAFAELPASTTVANLLSAPRMLLILGGLLTIFLAAYLHMLSQGRRRAERLAKRMTLHLSEREGQLHLALDSAEMGSWTWRADKAGFSADSRSIALLGLGRGPISDLFARLIPEDRLLAEKALERAAREASPLHFEGRLAAPSSGVRWIELSAQLTRAESGKITHATGLVRNVTERVEMILARKQLLSKLITAEEKERRRIARELHDQLGQEITALSLGLRNLQELTNESDARQDLLDSLKKLVGNIDTRVDRFTLDLRPVVLDDLGLDAALQAHFNQWTEVHGIELNSHLAGLNSAKLPFELVTTVFRVVQESLTNVARHAQASSVDVIVELSNGEIKVVVEDNGNGQQRPIGPQSYGLMGMRERVEGLGGQFRAESSTESGFSVFVRVPVVLTNQATMTL